MLKTLFKVIKPPTPGMRNSLLSQGCQIDSQYIVSVLGLHQEINVKSLMQYKSDFFWIQDKEDLSWI